MPMMLKTNKLVSKFENPRSGGESPFSQQRGRFLYNLRKRYTRSSLLAVEWTTMVDQTLGINSYVSGEEVGRNAKRFGREKVMTLASAQCELSVNHITGHPVKTSQFRFGHATFGLRISLQHERGGAYQQTKAFQTSQLSPNSHLYPNKTTTCGSFYAYRVNIFL